MKLCKGEGCRWYGDASKHGRKCFYEPQCILGWIDAFIAIIRITLKTRATLAPTEMKEAVIQ